MTNSELYKYITEARKRGITDDVIRQESLKSGWNIKEIDAALLSEIPPKKKIRKIVLTIILVIVGAVILLGIFGALKGSGDTSKPYVGKVQITEVRGFDPKLNGRNIVTDNKGRWFVWGSGPSWDTSFYKIEDATAISLKFKNNEFYPPNPPLWGTSDNSADVAKKFPESPAAYLMRFRAVGAPLFILSPKGNQYLVNAGNDPSWSLVYRLIGDEFIPFFDAPNSWLNFSTDGGENAYAVIANAFTGRTAVYRFNGDSITEIKNLENGYDYSFTLDGPDRSYVVTADGKGPDYDHPQRFANLHAFQIVGDHAVKVAQLEGYNRSINFSADGKGNIYATAQSNTKNTDYYKIDGNLAIKADKIPASEPQKNYGGETYGGSGKTTTFEDDIGNVYQMVIEIGEPFWKCQLFKVEGQQRYLVIDNLDDVGCADVYTNKKGEWIVVNKGDIYGGSKTRVYVLEGRTAYYVKDFEQMRYLTLSYDSTSDFWYGLTQKDKGDSSIDKDTYMYKISFSNN